MKPYESPRSTYSGGEVSRTFNFGFVLGVICAAMFALVLLVTLAGCAGRDVQVRRADGSTLSYRNDMFDTKVGKAEFATADGTRLSLENFDSQAALAKEIVAGMLEAFRSGIAAGKATAAPIAAPVDLLTD